MVRDRGFEPLTPTVSMWRKGLSLYPTRTVAQSWARRLWRGGELLHRTKINCGTSLLILLKITAKMGNKMSGDWNAKISFQGPHGQGQTTFNVNVKQ